MSPETSEESVADAAVLAAKLGDKEWQVRHDARMALQKLGTAATPYIIPVLREGHEDARWEAAKALVNIADPAATTALVASLDDDSYEIQWLAAEALIAVGKVAIIPVLEALIRNPESPALRGGAHHILHDLERKRHLSQPVLDVLDNIRSIGMNENMVILARKAIKIMKENPREAENENG